MVMRRRRRGGGEVTWRGHEWKWIWSDALSMTSAVMRATIQCTVFTVVSRWTDTGTVEARAMIAAARITEFLITTDTSPAFRTNARRAFARTMGATVQFTLGCRTKRKRKRKGCLINTESTWLVKERRNGSGCTSRFRSLAGASSSVNSSFRLQMCPPGSSWLFMRRAGLKHKTKDKTLEVMLQANTTPPPSPPSLLELLMILPES